MLVESTLFEESGTCLDEYCYFYLLRASFSSLIALLQVDLLNEARIEVEICGYCDEVLFSYSLALSIVIFYAFLYCKTVSYFVLLLNSVSDWKESYVIGFISNFLLLYFFIILQLE